MDVDWYYPVRPGVAPTGKGSHVTQSLSIVLPVRDAQASLRQTTESILEIVSELTDDFEILVVDDASTDSTEEVARDLAAQFPQLRVIRHRTPQGERQASQTGVGLCRGDVIFIKDDATPLRASDLRSLWAMREDEELVMARSQSKLLGPQPPHVAPKRDEPKPLDPALIARLMSWGAALEEGSGSEGRIQMIRRKGVRKIQEAGPGEPQQRADKAHISAEDEPASGPNPILPSISRSDQIRRRMPPRPVPTMGVSGF